MRRAIVVALAVASTIAIAAPALADDTDTDFLNALHRHGISNSASEDQGLIKLGHNFCTMLGQGYSMNAVIATAQLEASQANQENVKYMVNSAAAAYCPQYIP